jgi:hypothetical protein
MSMRLHGLLGCGLLLIVGCGDSSHALVSGKITMDGKPLADAAVMFQPMGGKMNPGAGSSGRTDANGEYTLEVIGGGKGAVIGKHRVEIHPTVDGSADDDRPRPPKMKIPLKFNLQSTLTYEVKPGNNTANFDLSSK